MNAFLPTHRSVRLAGVLALLAAVLCTGAPARAQDSILNVSYDVTREFYKDFNAAFVRHWKEKTGRTLTVNQSHGGSSKQARAVADGLEADVISMNQASDIDILHARGALVPADWSKRLPNASVPYTSTTVFLVRKGNPKKVRDWNDLVRPDVRVILPNPKTSGNGRYSYLAAWGYVLENGGDATKAREFVGRLLKNVPVLDGGGRGATTTFTQRGIGDVLLTFENEVELNELGKGRFEVVVPSVSIVTENPVAVVDKVVDKRGTRALAQTYLEYLYSPEGQEIIARHNFRPTRAEVLARHKQRFADLRLFGVQKTFGGWQQAQKTHFDDGAILDQLLAAAAR